MAYKSFVINIVVRITLILITSLLIARFYFVMESSQLVFSFLVSFSVLTFQVVELLWFATRTNRELSRFFLSIKHSDFSVNYSTNNKKSHISELHEAFNLITRSFKEVKIEREKQFEFLQLIVEQISIGLIAINGKNDIILMNSSAEKILGVQKPKTWKQLEIKLNEFTKHIDEIRLGGKKLIDLSGNSSVQLSVNVGISILLDEPHRIISFQDIKNEIEQKETEAWIRLIRILNHEIMNSVTPISSLTETILMILGNDENQIKLAELNEQKLADVIRSVKTIQKRSEGLFNFVTEYRKLTKIPTPKMEDILVNELIENVEQLWKPEMGKKQINLTKHLQHKNLKIKADPNLIEQVLINLVKNSIQALKNITDPQLTISVFRIEETVSIEIKDNGAGIPASILNDIFVPFYTTKEKGSGIGLSLSRQIMRMHGGTIKVHSEQNIETIFSLEFYNSQEN